MSLHSNKPSWTTLQLGECGQWVSGGTPQRSEPQYWNGDIPWFSAKSLKTFDLVDTEERITRLGIENGPSIVPPGTVLFVVRGMSLANEFRVGVTQKEATLNQDLRGIIPSDRVWSRYLAHFLRQSPDVMAKVDNASHGTKRIDSDQLKRIKVPLPPLAEQHRIASILDKADDIRRKRRETVGMLVDLRQSQFDEWLMPFFQPDVVHSYVPVSHFVERFEGGLNVATPESPTPETTHFILKVSAVTWGDYRPEESKPLPPEHVPPPEHLVRPGDLLFSRANTTELVGATVFVHETPPNRVLPDKLWRFVWKDPAKVEPLFVWALFNQPKIRYEIGRRATGTSGSMKNISMDKVLSIQVPFPELPVQRRIVRFLVKEKILHESMAKAKTDTDNLFDCLVQRAFRGEL